MGWRDELCCIAIERPWRGEENRKEDVKANKKKKKRPVVAPGEVDHAMGFLAYRRATVG